MPTLHRDLGEHIALVEILDRVLCKGVAISGEVVVAVADIDLVRLNLQLTLGASEALAPKLKAQVRKAVAE
jgi:hypothetical protein